MALGNSNRNMAHCDAGGARHPQHQEPPSGNLLRERTSLASNAWSWGGIMIRMLGFAPRREVAVHRRALWERDKPFRRII